MIENIKKYSPEDYEYQSGGLSKKELEVMEIGYIGVFFKYCIKTIKKNILKYKEKKKIGNLKNV
jgi:hypothetical protein